VTVQFNPGDAGPTYFGEQHLAFRELPPPAHDPRETPAREYDDCVSLLDEARHNAAADLVGIGMRAVIRDLQDYVYEHDMTGTINSSELRAYLLAQLIISGAVDGQS
jgi:hypothetical protein